MGSRNSRWLAANAAAVLCSAALAAPIVFDGVIGCETGAVAVNDL